MPGTQCDSFLQIMNQRALKNLTQRRTHLGVLRNQSITSRQILNKTFRSNTIRHRFLAMAGLTTIPLISLPCRTPLYTQVCSFTVQLLIFLRLHMAPSDCHQRSLPVEHIRTSFRPRCSLPLRQQPHLQIMGWGLHGLLPVFTRLVFYITTSSMFRYRFVMMA